VISLKKQNYDFENMNSTETVLRLYANGEWSMERGTVKESNLRINERLIINLEILNQLTRQEKSRLRIRSPSFTLNTTIKYGLLRIVYKGNTLFRTMDHFVNERFSITHRRSLICGERIEDKVFMIEIMDLREL